MNCRVCGCPLEEGALFCTNCGTKIQQTESVQPETPASVPPQMGGYAAGYAVPPQAPPVSASPLWQGLRKTLGSGSFLAVAVFLTLSLALMALGVFTGSSTQTTGSAAMQTGSLIFGTLLGCLPIILYVIGVWQLRSSSKTDGPLRGYGLIRGASIFFIVFLSIVALLLGMSIVPILLAWSAGKLNANTEGYDELMQLFGGNPTSALVLFGFFILALLLVLLYFIKLCSLMKTVREIDTTGMQSRPIPSYLNFAHISLIIFTLLGAGGVLLSASQWKTFLAQQGIAADVSLVSILGSVVNLGLLISLFLTIRELKKNLK